MKYVQLVVLLSFLTLEVWAKGTPPADKNFFFTIDFWIIFAYALLVAMGIYLWWIVRQKLIRHRQEIETLKTRVNTYITQSAQQTGTNEIRKQVEMLVANHPKWGDTQEEMNALINRLETLEASRSTVPANLQSERKKEKPAKTETFYMTYPVDNYFTITAKSDTRDNTIYKFQVRSNKTEADFEVHTTGAPIQEIINLVQTYIKPACDEENMPSPQARNIVTIQSGLAILEGNKWIIKKKALIRYE